MQLKSVPQYDDNGRLSVSYQSKALPNHEAGGQYGGEVEDLEKNLWTLCQLDNHGS